MRAFFTTRKLRPCHALAVNFEPVMSIKRVPNAIQPSVHPRTWGVTLQGKKDENEVFTVAILNV